MPTRDERRQRLASDLAALRSIAADARQQLSALPPKAGRTAAQRRDAARLRNDLIVARIVLNALGTPTDIDLTDEES